MFLYLDCKIRPRFFLNEFNSHCVIKVAQLIKYYDDDFEILSIRKLYFTLVCGELAVYFY